MKPKQWDAYLTYLDIIQKSSNRVWRDDDDFHEDIVDPAEDFRDAIDRKWMTERAEIALESLTYRERHIIYYRFFDEITLDQAGEEFNVTRERIRQIEAKALRKLRHPRRKQYFFEPEIWERIQVERIEEHKRQEEEKAQRKQRELEEERLKNKARQEHRKLQSEETKKANAELIERNLRHNEVMEEFRRNQEEKRRLEVARFTKEINEQSCQRKRQEQNREEESDREYFRQIRLRDEQERREFEEKEREKLFMANMKNEAINLIEQVQRNQYRLAVVKRVDDKTNDNRPYTWDSRKKKRIYAGENND